MLSSPQEVLVLVLPSDEFKVKSCLQDSPIPIPTWAQRLAHHGKQPQRCARNHTWSRTKLEAE